TPCGPIVPHVAPWSTGEEPGSLYAGFAFPPSNASAKDCALAGQKMHKRKTVSRKITNLLMEYHRFGVGRKEAGCSQRAGLQPRAEITPNTGEP
ncbi:MAG: hypothetical protein K2Z81_25465, partial [Cyanobacteria bacterium]|nr:hypothetical protein [Cyanobacteriota bacterium]